MVLLKSSHFVHFHLPFPIVSTSIALSLKPSSSFEIMALLSNTFEEFEAGEDGEEATLISTSSIDVTESLRFTTVDSEVSILTDPF